MRWENVCEFNPTRGNADAEPGRLTAVMNEQSRAGGAAGGGRRLTYSAREYDSDSGMYYYRSRHYNANYGRFDRVDDMRSGANWYAYGANNPNMYVDPFGYIENVGGNNWKATEYRQSPENAVRNSLGGKNYTSAQVLARVDEIAKANPQAFRKRADGTWGMIYNATFTVPDNNDSAKQAAKESLECPKCGKEMQIVEYVREAYAFLYKQWLISIDAWHEEPKRAPPEQPALELTYEIISDESGLVSEFADA